MIDFNVMEYHNVRFNFYEFILIIFNFFFSISTTLISNNYLKKIDTNYNTNYLYLICLSLWISTDLPLLLIFIFRKCKWCCYNTYSSSEININHILVNIFVLFSKTLYLMILTTSGFHKKGNIEIQIVLLFTITFLVFGCLIKYLIQKYNQKEDRQPLLG